RPRDSTGGSGANSASIVSACGWPRFGATDGVGFGVSGDLASGDPAEERCPGIVEPPKPRPPEPVPPRPPEYCTSGGTVWLRAAKTSALGRKRSAAFGTRSTSLRF